MVNIRTQVIETLENIAGAEHVKAFRPEGDVSLPLLTYAEITNTHDSKWLERNTYQIDIWASTFGEVVDYMLEVNAAMEELGFRRTYTSPDTAARVDKDLYHKAISYLIAMDTQNEWVLRELNN